MACLGLPVGQPLFGEQRTGLLEPNVLARFRLLLARPRILDWV